jgi:hypothetical protein
MIPASQLSDVCGKSLQMVSSMFVSLRVLPTTLSFVGDTEASISHNMIHITPDWVLTRSLLGVDLSVAVGDHYLVG